VSGIRPSLNGLIIGDTATIVVTAPNGTWLRWVFGGPGSLTIDGCTAVYSVTSIGSAYQTSATIQILSGAAPTPTPTATPEPCKGQMCGGGGAGRADDPTTGGEGGPVAVFVYKTITVNVYDPANQPQGACTLPGIAMSINSVPTTAVVVWFVMTPRTAPFFVGYPGRNVTVVDGDGLYTIQLFVNGVFRERIDEFARCPTAVIRR
jgi:hypothetical protein